MKQLRERLKKTYYKIKSPNSIYLYWWKSSNGYPNFGDEIAPLIISKLSKKKIIYCDQEFNGKLLAVGSILQYARNFDIIWGIGVNAKHKTLEANPKLLEVHAVRGPFTRQFLLNNGVACPEIYGDPGLLTSYLFPEWRQKQTNDFIVIPHISEIALFEKLGIKNLVLPNRSPEAVIQDITRARFVVSSSLHGLVLAESYGIPARLLRLTENEPIFKYNDYYYGSGRPEYKPAGSIEEALDLGGEAQPIYDLDALIKSFPFK